MVYTIANLIESSAVSADYERLFTRGAGNQTAGRKHHLAWGVRNFERHLGGRACRNRLPGIFEQDRAPRGGVLGRNLRQFIGNNRAQATLVEIGRASCREGGGSGGGGGAGDGTRRGEGRGERGGGR